MTDENEQSSSGMDRKRFLKGIVALAVLAANEGHADVQRVDTDD